MIGVKARTNSGLGLRGLGFRGLGFKVLSFKGLGFKASGEKFVKDILDFQQEIHRLKGFAYLRKQDNLNDD